MVKALNGRKSTFWIFGEHLGAEVLGFSAKVVPELGWEVNLALLVLPQDLVVIFGIEYELRRQQDVHNHP